MQDEKTLYAEKLQDPRWFKVRAYILKRDEYTCQTCDLRELSGHPLQVHHKEYINGREPWQYHPRLLVTLCAPCHRRHHDLDPLPAKQDRSHISVILDKAVGGFQ